VDPTTPRTVPAPGVARTDTGITVAWSPEAVLPVLLEALGAPRLLAQATRYRMSVSPVAQADAVRAIASDPGVQAAFRFALDDDAATDLLVGLGVVRRSTLRRAV